MSASRQLLPATSRPNGLRATPGLLAASAALGACALLAGCSASGLATASSAPAAGRGAAMGVAAGSQAAPEAVPAALPGAAAKQNPLPALLPARQAVIYTASLTVRAGDVRAAAARAARLAGAAGGYVSSETARFSHRHPADGTIRIQLKIPVASYQATLAALSAQLGTRLSLSQQAQDVTQTVADVTSRVASAQAAIAQLRRLLARAGTVSSLLMRPGPDQRRGGQSGGAAVPAARAGPRDQLRDRVGAADEPAPAAGRAAGEAAGRVHRRAWPRAGTALRLATSLAAHRARARCCRSLAFARVPGGPARACAATRGAGWPGAGRARPPRTADVSQAGPLTLARRLLVHQVGQPGQHIRVGLAAAPRGRG